MERQVDLFFAVFALKVEKNLATRSQTCHVTTLVGHLSWRLLAKAYHKELVILLKMTHPISLTNFSSKQFLMLFCTYDHFVRHQAAGNFIICLIATSVVLSRVLNQEWPFLSLIQ